MSAGYILLVKQQQANSFEVLESSESCTPVTSLTAGNVVLVYALSRARA